MATDSITTSGKATTWPKTGSSSAATSGISDKTEPVADQISSWQRLSRKELDDIYRKSRRGNLPQGDTLGTPLFAGWPAAPWLSALAHRLGWQGKVFDLQGTSRDAGVVVNKITPAGLNLIVAKVYCGESWLDGRETIIIDYSRTSLVARPVRDEIREVAPGLYLGKVWLGKRRVLDFALEVTSSPGS